MNVDLYKYKSKNPLIRWMLNNYFANVRKLYEKTKKEIYSCAELGCGEGLSAVRLLEFIDKSKKFSAFDKCRSSIMMAKELLPEIDFENKSILEVQQTAVKYDLVFLLEVLEHLEDPEEQIRIISHISQKYLIIGVPNEPVWRLCNMLRFKYLGQFGNTPGHINHWNPNSLRILTENNFGPVLSCIKSFPWIILLAKNKNY